MAGRQQDGGPVHGVEPEYTLPDEVHPPVRVGPPALVVGLTRRRRTGIKRGDVVAERVPPDIDDLARITRHADTPAAGPPDRPGRAEVLESAGDEAEYLIAAAGRLDPQLAVADQVGELAGVPGQPEKPVLLGYQLRRRAVVGALAVR